MPRDEIDGKKVKKPDRSPVAKANMHFGAHIEGHFDGEEKWLVPGGSHTYQIPVRWDEYYADQAKFDRDVALLKGYRFGFGVRCVPEEHRLWEGYRGSPVKPTSYQSFVDFLVFLIKRYGPLYVELLNEQNSERDEAKPFESYFGAGMIDGEDPEIGGARYREMLAYVYPRVKRACPKVSIHAGALMNNSFRNGFMRGIFKKGDRRKLADFLSFHYYLGINTPFDSIYEQIATLRRYTSLPFVLAETSVLAPKDSPELQKQQRDWLIYLMKKRSSIGLHLILWYTLANNGWFNSDAVFKDVPKPVYGVLCAAG